MYNRYKDHTYIANLVSRYKDHLDPSSLVPRPSYFAGVENEVLVHAVCACATF